MKQIIDGTEGGLSMEGGFFTTTASAVILGKNPKTFMTEIARHRMPPGDDGRTSREWRRISTRGLLRCRVAHVLAENGVGMTRAAEIAAAEFFEDGGFLVARRYSDGTVEANACGTNEVGQELLSYSGWAPGVKRPESFLIVNLNESRRWIAARIADFVAATGSAGARTQP